MIKRLFDICLSFFGLLLFGPVLISVAIVAWLQDFHSPFYIASRVGMNGKPFNMVKLRSMVVNADKTGVDSTASGDLRITPVGRFIRRYKLDELSQLWNVFKGDMSLVGPRPQVARDVKIYTDVERRLLSVKSGITDIASIIFVDEGEILKSSKDPDLAYNQLIRPWKSRLGLIYIDKRSFWMDIQLLCLTAIAMFSRDCALRGVQSILNDVGADEQVKKVASRKEELKPYPPPGISQVVTHR